MVRVFPLYAMVTAEQEPGQEGLGFEGDEEPASVKRQVQEKKARVEKPRKSLDDIDPLMVYNRIAEIVGLRSPAQMESERRERERQLRGDGDDGGDEEEGG
jgi:hypothetical protein